MDITTLAAAKKYTDSQRLGRVETKQIEMLTETELPFVYSEEAGMFASILEGVGKDFTAEKAIVVWDGIEYKCDVFNNGEGNSYFGNLGAFEGQPTGEPFIVDVSMMDNVTTVIALVEGETHVVSITVEHQEANTLDPKAFPVIDLGELPYGKYKELDLYICKRIDQFYEQRCPLMVKYKENPMQFGRIPDTRILDSEQVELLSLFRNTENSHDRQYVGAVMRCTLTKNGEEILMYHYNTILSFNTALRDPTDPNSLGKWEAGIIRTERIVTV